MKEKAKWVAERVLLAAVALAVMVAVGVLLLAFTPVKNAVLVATLLSFIAIVAMVLFVLMVVELVRGKQ